MSDSDFVHFGNVARGRLNQQCQYASRYVDGRHGYPNFGKGLRFRGTPSDYHVLEIHKDDVETFVDMVLNYRNSDGDEE